MGVFWKWGLGVFAELSSRQARHTSKAAARSQVGMSSPKVGVGIDVVRVGGRQSANFDETLGERRGLLGGRRGEFEASEATVSKPSSPRADYDRQNGKRKEKTLGTTSKECSPILSRPETESTRSSTSTSATTSHSLGPQTSPHSSIAIAASHGSRLRRWPGSSGPWSFSLPLKHPSLGR
mmetsp:Transcript_6322/g.13849  ORF Transcript_6322/g.13849 Transcript_6322/m.13849 type:complete len:180 (-) Transcript_6322:21-560(-)